MFEQATGSRMIVRHAVQREAVERLLVPERESGLQQIQKHMSGVWLRKVRQACVGSEHRCQKKRSSHKTDAQQTRAATKQRAHKKLSTDNNNRTTTTATTHTTQDQQQESHQPPWLNGRHHRRTVKVGSMHKPDKTTLGPASLSGNKHNMTADNHVWCIPMKTSMQSP